MIEGMISVIVPVYNGEKHIRKCLEGLCSQTYQNLEFLIVDNASTDHTADLVSSFEDPRIRLLKEPRKGVSNARNTGLNHVNGQFVSFLDADDFLEKDYFERLLSNIQNYDFVSCNFIEEYADDRIPRRNFMRMDQVCAVADAQTIRQHIEEHRIYVYVVTAKLFRADLLRHIRFRNLDYCEDAVFIMNILFRSMNYLCIPYDGYHYFFQENSATVKNDPQKILAMMEGELQFYDFTRNILERHGMVSGDVDVTLCNTASNYLVECLKHRSRGSAKGRQILRRVSRAMKEGRLSPRRKFMLAAAIFCLERKNRSSKKCQNSH